MDARDLHNLSVEQVVNRAHHVSTGYQHRSALQIQLGNLQQIPEFKQLQAVRGANIILLRRVCGTVYSADSPFAFYEVLVH